MIVYNGVSLNSVADVKIADIHVSPIQYDVVSRPRAISGGSDFVRNRPGIRTVTVTFGLLDEDKVNRQKSLMAISQWAKTDKEYRLEVPGHPEHYLIGVCTDKPSPSLRQWWESGLRLVFTCFGNPYWNAKGEKSVACGSDFFVLGDAPPLMRIERTVTGSAVTNQNYVSDDQTIRFSTIPVGNLTVDLENQTAYSENSGTITDMMQYYKITSKFIVPHTGAMKITGTGTVKYRERWE